MAGCLDKLSDFYVARWKKKPGLTINLWQQGYGFKKMTDIDDGLPRTAGR